MTHVGFFKSLRGIINYDLLVYEIDSPNCGFHACMCCYLDGNQYKFPVTERSMDRALRLLFECAREYFNKGEK